MLKKIIFILIGIIATNSISAQTVLSDNTLFLASIDSNTVKLRNKLFPIVWQGDLNIYGFEENEVPVYSNEDISFDFLDVNTSYGNLGINNLNGIVDTFHYQLSVSKEIKKFEITWLCFHLF